MPISRREEQQNDRFLAIKMLEHNVSVEKVDAIFNTTVRSVQRWRKAFMDFGEEGLLARQGDGRPPKVSSMQMSWVALTVKDDTPAHWELGSKLWTLSHIQQVIERG